MSAKFLNQQLMTSRRFAVGKGSERHDGREKHESVVPVGDDVSDVEPIADQGIIESIPVPAVSSECSGTSVIDKIIDRENQDIRRNALAEKILDTCRMKREVIEMVRESIAETRQRRETLDARCRLFESTLQSLSQLPGEVDADNLNSVRRTIEDARLELVRFQKDVSRRGDSGSAVELQNVTQWSGMPFMKMAKIGLALTWPIVLAVLIAVALTLLSLFSLFAVSF